MPTVTSSDGTSIAFDRAGAGPALILVDAAGGFRGFGPMGPLAEQLASAFTVFTYDRRGRGESGDTLPYAVTREVEDIQALIAAAGGSAFLHGFSSGAVLALVAAADEPAISKVALLEPPLDDEPSPDEPDLGAEVAELVAAGRRGDAVEHFNRSIGVPEEYLVGMRDAPWWPAMESLAHTLVYDTVITGSFPVVRLRSITAPALVINSEGTDERLMGWGKRAADALPNGRHVSLKGEWHGVAPEVLGPALVEFFTGQSA